MNISCLLCVTVLHESYFKALFLIGNRLHTISDAAAQLASCCPAGHTQRELYARAFMHARRWHVLHILRVTDWV